MFNHVVLEVALIGSLPGDTPVRLDLEDSRIFCVAELDIWVSQLSSIYVHHDRCLARGLACWGYTHYLLGIPPKSVGDIREDKRKVCGFLSHTDRVKD